jgi:glycosidase
MNKFVIYQVLPRLFGNTSNVNVKAGTIFENGCGKFNHFTFEALHGIKELGATHIWLTGIIEHATTTKYESFGIEPDAPQLVKGRAGSPYAIKDYYDVDPDLAENVADRMDEFHQLVDRIHRSGMKVIIDFVPNHVARHYVSDSKSDDVFDLGHSDDVSVGFSPQNNFYYLVGQDFVSPVNAVSSDEWHESPAKVTGNNCVSSSPGINDWYETVKLNYGVDIFTGINHFNPVPDTWHKMLHVLRYWAQKGINGFRCDMAEMVPVEFWNWAIKAVKHDYPDVMFIAEVYDPSLYRTYLNDGLFDLLYDKVGMYDTLRGVISGSEHVNALSGAWEAIADIHDNVLFFMENHDEQRLASTFFAGNALKGWPGTVVAATINSHPCMLYFGQEIGVDGMHEEGFSGLDGRTSIFDYWGIEQFQAWTNHGLFDGGGLAADQLALREKHKVLLSEILKEPAIQHGQFYNLMWANQNNPEFTRHQVFAYLRHYNDNVLLVIANFREECHDLRLIIPEHAFFITGLNPEGYYRSLDLLNSNRPIQFPAQVAVKNGIGVSLKSWSCGIYKLR